MACLGHTVRLHSGAGGGGERKPSLWGSAFIGVEGRVYSFFGSLFIGEFKMQAWELRVRKGKQAIKGSVI